MGDDCRRPELFLHSSSVHGVFSGFPHRLQLMEATSIRYGEGQAALLLYFIFPPSRRQSSCQALGLCASAGRQRVHFGA